MKNINTYKSYFKKLSLQLLLVICTSSIFAQNKDSKGTDFWLMFNTNYTGYSDLTVFITAPANTSGVVSVPGLGFSSPFSVTANTVTPVSIPTSVGAHTNGVIDNLGIHVTSLQEVSVYGLNRIPYTTDAYLGLPTDALGTDYMVLTYGSGSEIGIVGTVDGTIVTITPSVAVSGHSAGIPYTITLNQGQTYQAGGSGDLTGTIISGTNPIGVMGANPCTNIPPGVPYCDHICEMLPPITTWGKKFVTVPLKSRINGDTWRYLASEDNTIITINGVPHSAINKGQFIEQILTAQSIIESDKPILVAQYSNGSGYSGNPGDPFMMLIPPYEQFLANYTLTSVAGFVSHYINVVAPNSVVGGLTLDGVSIPAASYTPIGASGFSGAQLTVSEGSHTLSSTLPFGAFQYGFNNDDSYGYPGGQSFSPIAIVSSLVIAPKTGTALINTETCFDATVKDQYDAPVAGVRVDFTIAGPNSSSTGFANTDVNGIAHFCYTGTNEGSDNITASIGTINDAASFTWYNTCYVTVSAKKFYDLNADGLDNDGIAVQGWNITLSGTDENSVVIGPLNQSTGTDGTTNFTSVAKGSYTVSEGTQGNWISTTLTSVALSITDCNDPAQVKFGNVCIGSGTTTTGTFAPGYWTNKNGQSLINGSDLCQLNNLCLRDAAGNNFDPVANCPAPSTAQVNAGKTSLKNWLANATATNMSYMLSAQFAAMKLNVLKGIVNASKLIYAPGTSSANAAGFATVNAIITEANDILCANPVIDASSSLRSRAEAVKNALENANNNRNFVQAQPCSFTQSTIVQRSQTTLPSQITESNLFLKATPNPSRNYFNVQIKSNNTNQAILVRIFNSNGQLVEVRNNVKGGQVVQIGNNLKSGVYLIEAIQGDAHQTQTVIKQ